MEEAEPIAEFLIEGYLRHDFDSVIAFFTTFVTALRQDAVATRIFADKLTKS